MSDVGLLEHLKSGDREAFHKLYERYYPILLRHLFFRCQQTDLAEDIAQETFLKVWQNRTTLKPNKPFFALLAKIGLHLLLDRFRKEGTRSKYQDRVAESYDRAPSSPSSDLQHKELERAIRSVVLQNLPEKCRRVFLLNRMEGMSNSEIATMLGLSKKTVENQLYHALKVIRRRCAEWL